MYPYHWVAAQPKPPRPGARFRKKGETLPWTLLAIDGEDAVLEGPGNCKGLFRTSLTDLNKDFVKE